MANNIIMTASVKELSTYINRLSSEEKSELTLALKKQFVLQEAQRLSSSNRRKKIPVQDIVNEIRLVRNKRSAKKSRT